MLLQTAPQTSQADDSPAGSRATRRRAWLAGSSVVLVVAATAGPALASGGVSIARAPTIGPGVVVSEDSSTDATGSADSLGQGCFNNVEFWRLSLTSGDKVEIMGQETPAAVGFRIVVLAAGTTDKNIATASAVARGSTPAGGPLKFTAPATGVYPMLAGPSCHNGTDGPFGFVVTVSHAAVALVSLPPVREVASGATIVATVRRPNGSSITDKALVLRLYGTWKDAPSAPAKPHLLATASPVNGSARFSVRLPARLRGTTVTLQVTGRTAGYADVSSAVQRATVS